MTTLATKLQSEPSRELYDLVLSKNWHYVVRHAKGLLGSRDASFRDPETQQTPLHAACKSRPPVRVIRSLIEAFPAGLAVESSQGALPLHNACHFNASLEVLRELTKDNPSTASFRSSSGKTAVRVLWEERETTKEIENYSNVFWQKMQVLIEAVATTRRQLKSGMPDSALLVLHAVVSLTDCPDAVIQYALQKYPEQVRIRNDSDRLPLHIAVACDKVACENGTLPSSAPLRRLTTTRADSRCISLIQKLVSLHPEGARVSDPNEVPARYPLHTAVLNGHGWYEGVRELFEAAPEKIHVVDPVHALYHFQLASLPIAQGKLSDDATGLDTIFNMLRVNPCTLDDLIRCAKSSAGGTNRLRKGYADTQTLFATGKASSTRVRGVGKSREAVTDLVRRTPNSGVKTTSSGAIFRASMGQTAATGSVRLLGKGKKTLSRPFDQPVSAKGKDRAEGKTAPIPLVSQPVPAKRPSVHMVAKRITQSMAGKSRAPNPSLTPPLVRTEEKKPNINSKKSKAEKLSVMPAWESMRLAAEQFRKRMVAPKATGGNATKETEVIDNKDKQAQPVKTNDFWADWEQIVESKRENRRIRRQKLTESYTRRASGSPSVPAKVVQFPFGLGEQFSKTVGNPMGCVSHDRSKASARLSNPQ